MATKEGIDALDGFSVDEANNLYHYGRRVVTEQHVKLNMWVNVSIILAGFGAATSALIDLVKYLTS